MALSSKYQIGTRLGGGGMAEVYLGSVAGAEGFARSVAIKRVLPAYSDNEQFSRMFIEEARVCSQLRHANIVSVSDFDRDESGRLMLVMELVEGKDLSTLMATGMLPLSVVIHVVEQVLRGLGYAHELPHEGSIKGIVHRDVSPHNVLLSWQGAVKVSDFGIAKAWQTSQATGTLSLKGKPSYMSPEQARGEALDGRSDLFAVGIMLFELITGQRLFGNGVSLEETLSRLFFQPLISPKQYRPDCPDDLANITMLLLDRDKARRYPNARYVINDLLLCRDASPRGADLLAQLMAERFADAPSGVPVAIGPAFSGAVSKANSAPAHGGSQPWSTTPAWQTPEAWQPPRDPAAAAQMMAPTQSVAQAGLDTTIAGNPRACAGNGNPTPTTPRWKYGVVIIGSLVIGGSVAVVVSKPWARTPLQPLPGVAHNQMPADVNAAPSPQPVATSAATANLAAQPAKAMPPAIASAAAAAAAATPTPTPTPTPAPPPVAPADANPKAVKRPDAAKGMLRVITRPPSEVFVGKRSAGYAPLNYPLPPGSYKIKLVGPDNKTKTVSVRIKSGATEEIEHTW